MFEILPSAPRADAGKRMREAYRKASIRLKSEHDNYDRTKINLGASAAIVQKVSNNKFGFQLSD
jgi:hypothetical protein